MSTATEIDVAVPESETVMASDAVWRSNMSRLGDLVCVNCPVDGVVAVPPPPVLLEDRTKSDAVTPVTFSLNVAS